MADDEVVEVATTFPGDSFWRTRSLRVPPFLRAMVEQGFAACAQGHTQISGVGGMSSFGSVLSFYRWKGKTEKAREIVLTFKTTRARVPELVAAIRRFHPYDVPYIALVPLEILNPDYTKWAREATATTRSARARRKR